MQPDMHETVLMLQSRCFATFTAPHQADPDGQTEGRTAGWMRFASEVVLADALALAELASLPSPRGAGCCEPASAAAATSSYPGLRSGERTALMSSLVVGLCKRTYYVSIRPHKQLVMCTCLPPDILSPCHRFAAFTGACFH